MFRPCSLHVGTSLNVGSVGRSGVKAHSGRSLGGDDWKNGSPSLGLLTVAWTWPPASAAATWPPPDWGTYLKGLVPASFWMRRNRISSSCLEPVPDTVSSDSLAALMKSSAVFHGLSSLTHR